MLYLALSILTYPQKQQSQTGVCLNLGFDELYEASAEITEKLRGKETAGSEDMFQKVEEKYQKTVNAIKGLE